MNYGTKELDKIFNDYYAGLRQFTGVEVEIMGGENELPPIELLRAYEADAKDIDAAMSFASRLVANKTVRFTKESETVFEVTCTNGDLNKAFTTAPWYLDLLLKVTYGILLKKLTPPSSDSSTNDAQ